MGKIVRFYQAWAKRYGLCGVQQVGGLSSYAFTLMCIFALQVRCSFGRKYFFDFLGNLQSYIMKIPTRLGEKCKKINENSLKFHQNSLLFVNTRSAPYANFPYNFLETTWSCRARVDGDETTCCKIFLSRLLRPPGTFPVSSKVATSQILPSASVGVRKSIFDIIGIQYLAASSLMIHVMSTFSMR